MLLAEIPGSFEVNEVSNEIVYTSITHLLHYNVFRTYWISRVRIPCEIFGNWDVRVRSQVFEGCDLNFTILVKYIRKLYGHGKPLTPAYLLGTQEPRRGQSRFPTEVPSSIKIS